MQKYQFREDAIFKGRDKVDAQVAGEIIAALLRRKSPDVPPETAIVNAVIADPDHHLRPCFTLDEHKAAFKQWEREASAIIRAVQTIRTEEPDRPAVRAFHSIKMPDQPRQRYTVREVQRSVDLQFRLLQQASRELEAFERRYSDLVDICELVSQARKLVDDRLAKAREPEHEHA